MANEKHKGYGYYLFQNFLCGVAIELGSKFEFSGMILESPFSSVKDVFRIRYPLIKVVKINMII